MTEGEERKEKGRNENHKNDGMMKPELKSSDYEGVHCQFRIYFILCESNLDFEKKIFLEKLLSKSVAIIHHELNTFHYITQI